MTTQDFSNGPIHRATASGLSRRHLLATGTVLGLGSAIAFSGGQAASADTLGALVPSTTARTNRIDAAVNWGNGKVYIFRGSEYVRFDIATDRVDAGYPKPIKGHWHTLWSDRIDAAVDWGNGKVYIFRGSEYVRFDIATDRVDAGYPKPIKGHWPGL